MKRKTIFKSFSLMFILIWMLPLVSASLAHVDYSSSSTQEYVLGEVLVKFRSGVTPRSVGDGVETGVASIDLITRQFGIATAESLFSDVEDSAYGLERIYKLSLSPTSNVWAVVEALAADANVEYAEPNYIYNTYGGTSKYLEDSSEASALQCDPEIFFGVRHCTDDSGDTNLLLIDLNDPHVQVQTVLSSRNGVECNSVNHSGKDATSNCAAPYPFERVSDMLGRYVASGAVAIINTDYFGGDGDHGAEGLAVRNGVRLDGESHSDTDDGAYLGSTTPSLAFSPSNVAVIGVPGSEETINEHVHDTYYNAVGGAPIIVSQGQPLGNRACSPSLYPGDTCISTSQSAAGLTDDGQLVLITAKKDATGIADYLTTNLQVHTSIKFDGGGSARMAWLESDGQIQSFGATDENRYVAEGLLIFSTRISSDDSYFEHQWGLHNSGQTGGTYDADIDAPEAWEITTGSDSVVIGVIDTGVDYNHVDLNDGRVLIDIDKDFVNDDDDAMDDNGHGTHVAGTIAAETNNGVGVAGVMWKARILPLKVCNSRGGCNSDDVAAAIRYAADNGANVINMSLGGYSCSTTIADAVNYAYFDKGVVIIAAAGNSGGSIAYPAKLTPVIATGAIDHNDIRAFFSSYGDKLDVVAPGVGIWSTVPNGGYDSLSGTSMASPHVAGVAGLLLAQRLDLTNDQVREILRQSADDLGESGFDRFYGFGRVNAAQALTTDTPSEAETPEQAECPLSVCGASVAVAGEADGESILGNLRSVRDQVFTQDPGQRWVDIYYQHQFEVAWLVMTDSQIRSDALAGFRAFEPVFRALLSEDSNDSPVMLTPELIETAERALMGVAEESSSEVREDILREWEKVKPDRFIGWDVQDVWNQLILENQSNMLYLPLVSLR